MARPKTQSNEPQTTANVSLPSSIEFLLRIEGEGEDGKDAEKHSVLVVTRSDDVLFLLDDGASTASRLAAPRAVVSTLAAAEAIARAYLEGHQRGEQRGYARGHGNGKDEAARQLAGVLDQLKQLATA